jgi:hypothetical protein
MDKVKFNQVIDIIKEKFEYDVRVLQERVAVYYKYGKTRLMLENDESDPHAIKVSFSLTCRPHEVSMVTWELSDLGLAIIIMSDFYVNQSSGVTYGDDALKAYINDIVELVDSERKTNVKPADMTESKDLAKLIADHKVYIKSEPIPSTLTSPDKVKPYKTFTERMLEEALKVRR